MRDIKHHKLNALPLTKSRKPTKKARSKKSLTSYNIHGGGNDAS